MLTIPIDGTQSVGLPFTLNLTGFLANRTESTAFRLDKWLQSLDGESLERMRRHVGQITDADPSESIGDDKYGDILVVVIRALAAERQTIEVIISPDELFSRISLLGILATMEQVRRTDEA